MARIARPWYHSAKQVWRVWWNGSQRSLGVRDANDEAGAWAAFERLRSGGEKGQDPAPAVRTVKVAVREYLEARKTSVKPYTLRMYGKYLGYFCRRFGSVPVASPTVEDILTRATEFNWGPNNLRNYLCVVEMLFRWEGHAVELKKPARESAGAGVVIPEAVHSQAVAVADGDLAKLLCYLWFTGCRPSEATALTADMVDWDAGTVRLREHKTKGKGRQRIIYLSPPALDVLAGQALKYEADGLLFRSRRGTAFAMTGLAQAMCRISRRIGHRVTAYGYRHTYATRALQQGIPDSHVAALLGHGSTRMIHAHYSHLSQNAKMLKDVAARIE